MTITYLGLIALFLAIHCGLSIYFFAVNLKIRVDSLLLYEQELDLLQQHLYLLKQYLGKNEPI